jgi:hypothetical protein
VQMQEIRDLDGTREEDSHLKPDSAPTQHLRRKHLFTAIFR